MPTYELPGESRQRLFPTDVDTALFHGVEVLCIVGTQEEIRETTEMLDTLYPNDEKRTLGDAQFIYYARYDKQRVEIYQLIVLRKADSK